LCTSYCKVIAESNADCDASKISILPSWLEADAFNDAEVASNEDTLAPIEPPPPSEVSIVSNLLSTDVDKVLIVDAKLALCALALANAPAAESTFVNNLLFTDELNVVTFPIPAIEPLILPSALT